MHAITVPRARFVNRPHVPVVLLAAAMAVATVVMAMALDLPLRDPDGLAGPAYVRLPLIIAIMFALDVIPRTFVRWRGGSRLRAAARAVIADRWSGQRFALVLTGLVSFYVIYVAYRNLKSFLPFARDGLADPGLLDLDRAMAFGQDPATLLHTILGTGVSAHVLSVIYIFFLVFVPMSLGAALVWSRDLRSGYWWVTALCVNWVLGVLSYYVLPSLGPAFVLPELFSDLPVTGVSELQNTLQAHRLEVLRDPFATVEVQGIAGFASLHVAIVFSAALLAHLLRLARAIRWAMWAFLAATVLATIYFGWHYLVDDLAGFVIGGLAVWIGALATGHQPRLRPAPAPSTA
jgi:hypothetical protein